MAPDAKAKSAMPHPAADRLSTQEEVRRAASLNPEGMLELCRHLGLPCETRNERGELEAMDASELELLLHLQSMDGHPLN